MLCLCQRRAWYDIFFTDRLLGTCQRVEQCWFSGVWLVEMLLGCITLTSSIIMCSSSISYKYPWTIGAAYPTTVPHSESDAAGSPAHLDPTCQSHSTYPALCHGVSPGRAMGGLGRQHSSWGNRVARSRPHPGKTHRPMAFCMQGYTRLATTLHCWRA